MALLKNHCFAAFNRSVLCHLFENYLFLLVVKMLKQILKSGVLEVSSQFDECLLKRI